MLFDSHEYNAEHIGRHGVTPEEVEDALLDPDRTRADAYNRRGERRWASPGATESGRLLFVVYTRRDERIRVVTAREAEPRERRRYL